MADIYNDPNLTYDSYIEPTIPTVGQQVLTPNAITNINGLTGPTITFSGGTTGFSFTPAGTTVLMAGTLTVAHGGTNATAQVTNGISYFDGTKITSGNVLVFDGTNLGVGVTSPSSRLQVVGLAVYANNAAAIAAGLTAGAFYRTGADPDVVCVVH